MSALSSFLCRRIIFASFHLVGIFFSYSIWLNKFVNCPTVSSPPALIMSLVTSSGPSALFPSFVLLPLLLLLVKLVILPFTQYLEQDNDWCFSYYKKRATWAAILCTFKIKHWICPMGSSSSSNPKKEKKNTFSTHCNHKFLQFSRSSHNTGTSAVTERMREMLTSDLDPVSTLK